MRIALLHTGAVVIATFAELTKEHWGSTEVLNLLDDKIVADLRRPDLAPSVPRRLVSLAGAAAAAGADAVVLTCSSISGFAAETAAAAGLPVLRIDEAMADEAARISRDTGGAIAVVATLSTTLTPTVALLRERLALSDPEAGPRTRIDELLADGAFEAIVAGDRATHDALVGDAVRGAARTAQVVVLAQASMVSAVDGVEVDVPVLSSPGLGVRRVASLLGLG